MLDIKDPKWKRLVRGYVISLFKTNDGAYEDGSQAPGPEFEYSEPVSNSSMSICNPSMHTERWETDGGI